MQLYGESCGIVVGAKQRSRVRSCQDLAVPVAVAIPDLFTTLVAFANLCSWDALRVQGEKGKDESASLLLADDDAGDVVDDDDQFQHGKQDLIDVRTTTTR